MNAISSIAGVARGLAQRLRQRRFGRDDPLERPTTENPRQLQCERPHRTKSWHENFADEQEFLLSRQADQADASTASKAVRSQAGTSERAVGRRRAPERVHAQFERLGKSDLESSCNYYMSDPAPPPTLWDLHDAAYMRKVKCKAVIRLISLDPKLSRFDIRISCHWGFRTPSDCGHTDTILNLPDVRMPRLVFHTDESRVWRDVKLITDRTIYWRGYSVYTCYGFDCCEMRDFPYDRQIIDLGLLDFVWRSEDEKTSHSYLMNVVNLKIEVHSMIAEWEPHTPLILPRNEHEVATSNLISASRFFVQLRLQRKSWNYVIQVFLVNYLITNVAIFPLTMAPTLDHAFDRLQSYALCFFILLTFRRAISQNLPKVEYTTFADKYILASQLTVFALSFEAIVAYRFLDIIGYQLLDDLEDTFIIVLCGGWAISIIYVAFFKGYKPWPEVQQRHRRVRQRTRLERDATEEEKARYANRHDKNNKDAQYEEDE